MSSLLQWQRCSLEPAATLPSKPGLEPVSASIGLRLSAPGWRCWSCRRRLECAASFAPSALPGCNVQQLHADRPNRAALPSMSVAPRPAAHGVRWQLRCLHSKTVYSTHLYTSHCPAVTPLRIADDSRILATTLAGFKFQLQLGGQGPERCGCAGQLSAHTCAHAVDPLIRCLRVRVEHAKCASCSGACKLCHCGAPRIQGQEPVWKTPIQCCLRQMIAWSRVTFVDPVQYLRLDSLHAILASMALIAATYRGTGTAAGK